MSLSFKVAYVTAIFPYLVLITLLVKGLTLDGAPSSSFINSFGYATFPQKPSC